MGSGDGQYPAPGPPATSVKNFYDAPGNLIKTINQDGYVVRYTYDAANQLKTVIQQNAPSVSPNNTNFYGYDNLGNLTGLTDERGDTTQNAYNLLSELTQKILPVTTLTETRNYDYAGNLTSLVHFDGTTTTYTYDTLNRLTGQSSNSPHAEPAVSFTYTNTGKYLTSTAQDGTVNYAYDALDRLITKATPEGTLSYTYYSTGKVESIQSSNANGATVSYTYDGLNRLSTVVDNRLPSNNTTSYTYDNASNVATVAYPNGLTSTFTYDELNRVTELSTPPIADYRYTLGLTGNRTNATELNEATQATGRTLQWTYNGIYQLTHETITGDPANDHGNNGYASYTLDPVGNRTGASSTFGGFTPRFGSYNPNDQLSSETYDNNVTGTPSGKSYVYDSENHMISMTHGSTSVTMKYDAFGNRVSKTVNGVTTQYLVDDLNPTGYPQVLDELTGSAVQRTYTYGLQRISQDQFISPAWVLSYYQYDGGGSVRQLTNSIGQVTDSYEYDAFGNSFTKQGTTPNNYLYRGEQYDSDLGLYYLRARYYNPLTGRFLSVDPEAAQGQRRYEYAGADPVNGMDPSGNEAIIEFALLRFYPGRLGFIQVHFPTGCGVAGGASLPGCGGSGGGNGGGPHGPGGPPPSDPPPPPPPACDAQLKYRPVNILNKTHAFWYIYDINAQTFVIDGGPSNGDVPPWGDLVDWVTLGNVSSRYPADNASLAGTWFDSGFSSKVCGQVAALEVTAEDWNSSLSSRNPYWAVGGPNSNSFARYVGEEGLFNPTAPPGSEAWSHTIDTPQGPR